MKYTIINTRGESWYITADNQQAAEDKWYSLTKYRQGRISLIWRQCKVVEETQA